MTPSRLSYRPNHRFGLPALALLTGLISPGVIAQTKPAATAVPATYATQAEAEQAARQHFHCSGAHRMGQEWMPCSQHGQANTPQHAH